MRVRFRGEIAGVGSSGGTRVVVGRWPESPFGAVADAMVETAAGHRLLLAPTRELADFVAATYAFDEIRVEPVEVTATAGGRRFRSPSLRLDLAVGRPTSLGRLVAAVPESVAQSPAWCAVTDPVARLLLRGVRTRGSAGGGRREWYGATGVRAVTALTGDLDGVDLGALAPVDPPCRFGFSSTPRRPSLTRVTTTIDLPEYGRDMAIRKGSTVTWAWGNGRGEGTVTEVHHDDVTRTTGGSEITRHGSDDDPAYVIEQEDGTVVLKLRSEVESS